MAPVKTKKRQSSLAGVSKSPISTPTSRIARKMPMITQGQKQALIDNLQLEITERARKLRAQYALQAQSLKTRIELRVNRIPTALRKATVGELLKKYTGSAIMEKAADAGMKASPGKPTARTVAAMEAKPHAVASPTVSRSKKRCSDIMDEEDKENTPDPTATIPNPKKRTKVAASTNDRRAPNMSTVLSPKSSNSRTLPQSPIRPPYGSPTKSTVYSRPASPLKPPSPMKAAAVAATNALSSMVGDKIRGTKAAGAAGRRGAAKPAAETKTTTGRAKRGAATATTGVAAVTGDRAVSGSSNTSGTSSTSTGTTIVKKVGRALNGSNAAITRKPVAGGTVAAKKVAAAKAKKAESSGTVRRTLRKRP